MTASNHLPKEKAKILLVDDVEANLLVLEAVLDEADREFYMASSAEEALGLVMKHHFTLIMLDVQMPDINGFELAKMLKQNRRTSKIPIIFVTAHQFDADDELDEYEEGAVDYLSKPFNTQIARAKVAAFVNMEYHRRENERIRLELEKKDKALEDLSLILSEDFKESLRTVGGLLNTVLKENQHTLDESSLEQLKNCANRTASLDKSIQELVKKIEGLSNVNGRKDVFS